jgi:hypothetical protein
VPYSFEGSDRVHKILADLSVDRRLFSPVFGGTEFNNSGSPQLLHTAGTELFTQSNVVPQYGFIGAAFFGSLFLIFAVFIILLFIFSSKTRWSDLRGPGSQYECGADQTTVRVSPAVAVAFFRLLVVFLIFELEIFV